MIDMAKGNLDRAERNRSIVLSTQEMQIYRSRLLRLDKPVPIDIITNTTINQVIFHLLPLLPDHCIDLLFIDPPYNITKSLTSTDFSKTRLAEYASCFTQL